MIARMFIEKSVHQQMDVRNKVTNATSNASITKLRLEKVRKKYFYVSG